MNPWLSFRPFFFLFFRLCVGEAPCEFAAAGLRYNLSALGTLRGLGSSLNVYVLRPCGDVPPSLQPPKCGARAAPAVEDTPGACLSLAASGAGAPAALPDGALGVAVSFEGGAADGCGGVSRAITLFARCAAAEATPFVTGEGACLYAMRAATPAACPLECRRDAAGAVCGGAARGNCVRARKPGARTPVVCECRAGFFGVACEVAGGWALGGGGGDSLRQQLLLLGVGGGGLLVVAAVWLWRGAGSGVVAAAAGDAEPPQPPCGAAAPGAGALAVLLLLAAAALSALLFRAEAVPALTAYLGVYEPPLPHRGWEALNLSTLGAGAPFERLCAEAAVCRAELYGGFWSHQGGVIERSAFIGMMDTNCGTPGGEFSMADNAAAQAWLHATQHPAHCADAKLGVVGAYHRGGIGSSLHFAVYTALRIMAEGRVAVFGPGWAWANCPAGSPDCYFLPFSGCAAGDSADVVHYEVDYPPLPLHRPAGWPFPHKSWAFARSHVLRYLLRPRPEVARFVEGAVAAAFPRGLPRPLAALFVRWQDKGVESPTFGIDAYFEQLAPIAGALRLRDVYLGSDDARAVAEARAAYGAAYAIHTLDIPRNFSLTSYAAAGGTSPLGGQMLVSLADLYLQAHADVWVGTLSSNWCRMVDELRTAAGKACLPFLDVDGRYLTEGTRRRRAHGGGEGRGA